MKKIYSTKKCIRCGKEFSKRDTCGVIQWDKTFCCSKVCANKNRIGNKYSDEINKKKGKTPTPEKLIKMSKATLKRYASGEKFGFQKGVSPYNKGKPRTWKTPQFEKGHIPYNKGVPSPREKIEKMIKTKKKHGPYFNKHKGEKHPEISMRQMGNKNPNWTGGLSPENMRIRKSMEARLWKEAILIRDDFTDAKTGIRGGKLEVHHIQNFSQYPELRFAIDNGITLSKVSHELFHKIYGRRNNTMEQLLEFLNN